MRTALRHDNGTGRQLPVPFFLRRCLALPLFCLYCLPAMAIPTLTPDLHIDWKVHRESDRIEVAPVLTCSSACRLRYDLRTVDNPGQSLRQAGEVQLAPGLSRTLGRLAFTLRGPHCRLQLTLRDSAGHEQTHVLDPCSGIAD